MHFLKLFIQNVYLLLLYIVIKNYIHTERLCVVSVHSLDYHWKPFYRKIIAVLKGKDVGTLTEKNLHRKTIRNKLEYTYLQIL